MLPTVAYKAICHSPSNFFAFMGTTIAITAAATFWCVRGFGCARSSGKRCFWSKSASEVTGTPSAPATSVTPVSPNNSNNATITVDDSMSYLCNSCGTEKYSSDQLSATLSTTKSPYKMVILVRSDLNMGKGKAAAQCCHAVLAAFKNCRQPEALKRWEREGQPKVTLKIDTEDTMVELMGKARSAGITAESIRDAGRTQVAAGTRTVCAIGPAPAKLIDAITGHLKLY